MARYLTVRRFGDFDSAFALLRCSHFIALRYGLWAESAAILERADQVESSESGGGFRPVSAPVVEMARA